MAKYATLSRSYKFIPIALESLGPCNADALAFIREVGRRMTLISGDPRETTFLMQRISVINQRCNATAVSGCFADLSPGVF